MSLVYVVLMSCISFIGWTAMSLEFIGIFFHIYGPYITTYSSNFKSPYHPSSLNCQYDLVTNSFPTMDPFAHGETIPLIFSVICDIYSNISEPREIYYIFMKVLHRIGKKIDGLIHDMIATHEADFVESFDVIWEIFYRDIFSMIYYASISYYYFIKYILI